jgi:uncharacterized repeat protein (TIGR03806 family)
VCAALALVACFRGAQPVRYFAEGRPAKLSDWRVVYAAGGDLALNDGVVPYDLNTPLFSDYAHKLRTIWIPHGSSAKYDADGSFDFPVGTIISKTFYYPLPKGAARDANAVAANAVAANAVAANAVAASAVARSYDQSTEFGTAGRGERGLKLANVHLVETRILVRRAAGWEALPYVWNSAQTEALLSRTGDVKALELVADDGAKEPFTYVVPNENQCAGCHVADLKTKQIAPIGTKARHLNRDYPYAAGNENQLLHWTKLGYLTGAPDAANAPKNADWRDAAQPLDARARAYLDINCGHCHSAKGPANTTALDLTIFAAADRYLGVCKPPVAAGRGTGDHFFDIVPGKPQDSILPYRMRSHEPGVMMPEQGRATTHAEGVVLIEQWISTLHGTCDTT